MTASPFTATTSLLDPLLRAMERGESALFEGLWNGAKAFLLAHLLHQTGKNLLLITPKEPEELLLLSDLPFFGVTSVAFPSWEAPLSEGLAPSCDIVGERFSLLHSLKMEKKPRIIAASLQALLQKLLTPNSLLEKTITLSIGQEISFGKLIQRLSEIGYDRSSLVKERGEFAVRGGIIDLFPVDGKEPYRIECLGEEIDSIRRFDPASQRSLAPINSLTLFAAKELELLEKEFIEATIFDYLDEETIVIFDDLLAIEDRFSRLVTLRTKENRLFLPLSSFFSLLGKRRTLYLVDQPLESLSEVHYEDRAGYGSRAKEGVLLRFSCFERPLRARRFPSPFAKATDYLEGDLSLIADPVRLEKLFSALTPPPHLYLAIDSAKERADWEKKFTAPFWQERLSYCDAYLSSSLALSDGSLLLIAIRELTGHVRVARHQQRNYHSSSTPSTIDLERGAFVVHERHGIGRFCGIEEKKNNLGLEEEYFRIEYGENGQLFVPLTQASLLTKYVGSFESPPSLHTLGNSRWRQQLKKAQDAIDGYAEKLLTLYAKRSIAAVAPVPLVDSEFLKLFEEEFAYEPTEDQLKAFAEIKADLSSTTPMDRLLVGDVGYGKTEVAMRAAFKMVVDGKKQVALLVPTAVLGLQHYETFCERMAHFPVKIALLSRFTRAKILKSLLAEIAAGTIDIVIGTHRLLGKDVLFKDLGLFIIDEEQRFGVKAKESLKEAKVTAHALSMSATPIPRTLHLSISGVRAISEIKTPPQDRLPIHLSLEEESPQLIRSLLERELSRDGQAFVIHNDVETIFTKAAEIRELLPMAKIAVAHGQMECEELSSVFHAFKEGRVDILVATTVVENGIDIPNANTILILRADRYGLSNLYQLAGRVGRWHRRAFAYFLVPSLHRLSLSSRHRFDALLKASTIGGGMHVALRDLELRGAGDLLGSVQSGHATTIGFHLYCQKLKKAIQRLRGHSFKDRIPCKVELPFVAKLTDRYIEDSSLRLQFYQRFGEAESESELLDLFTEIRDRFGPLPQEAEMLKGTLRLQRYLEQHSVEALSYAKGELSVQWRKGDAVASFRLFLNLPNNPDALVHQVQEALTPLLSR